MGEDSHKIGLENGIFGAGSNLLGLVETTLARDDRLLKQSDPRSVGML